MRFVTPELCRATDAGRCIDHSVVIRHTSPNGLTLHRAYFSGIPTRYAVPQLTKSSNHCNDYTQMPGAKK